MIYLADPTSHRHGHIIDNIGDEIIKSAVLANFPEVESDLSWVALSGRSVEVEREKGDMLVLAGANILANRPYLNRHVWRPSASSYLSPQTVVLFGVGWWKYQRAPGFSTKAFYRHFLSVSGMHSVRDSMSLSMLSRCGISNVINTGCPTMWGLPDLLRYSPTRPESVVFTLTDYAQDPSIDRWLVDFLLKTYKRVYFFPQGAGDAKYLQGLVPRDCIERIVVIDRKLCAYDALLEKEELDYVGTRLHGGIRALQKNRRAIIIALDNRAESISADTGLPTIRRQDIRKFLPELARKRTDTYLRLNRKGIDNFLESLQIRCAERN